MSAKQGVKKVPKIYPLDDTAKAQLAEGPPRPSDDNGYHDENKDGV